MINLKPIKEQFEAWENETEDVDVSELVQHMSSLITEIEQLRKKLKNALETLKISGCIDDEDEIEYLEETLRELKNHLPQISLSEKMKKYPTIEVRDVGCCGNNWFFEKEKTVECTTCAEEQNFDENKEFILVCDNDCDGCYCHNGPPCGHCTEHLRERE